MEIEVMIYGYIECYVDDNEVKKETNYFASERDRDETMMLEIADNPYSDFYPFEKVEYVEV